MAGLSNPPVHEQHDMGSTARVLSQVEREHEHADNDDSPTRIKRHVLPSGRESFIRADGTGQKRKKPRYRGRKEWSPGKVISNANMRESNIRKTIVGRHNGPCNTDDGEMYLRPALRIIITRFFAMKHDGRNPKPVDAYAWAQRWTPRLAAEHGRAWFDEMQERLIRELELNPAPLPTPDELAQELQNTHAEVIAFKLRGAGAIDRLAPQRLKEAKAAEVARKRRKRKENAATIPHTESMMQIKPWDALGMSRSTYYRKVYAGELPKHPCMRRLRPRKRA